MCISLVVESLGCCAVAISHEVVFVLAAEGEVFGRAHVGAVPGLCCTVVLYISSMSSRLVVLGIGKR